MVQGSGCRTDGIFHFRNCADIQHFSIHRLHVYREYLTELFQLTMDSAAVDQ